MTSVPGHQPNGPKTTNRKAQFAERMHLGAKAAVKHALAEGCPDRSTCWNECK